MEGMVMDLKDIMDLKKLQDLQNHYEEVTGLKAVIVGKTGESLTYTNNFRAEEGGMTIPVIVNEEKIGAVISEKSSERSIKNAAELLGTIINQFANFEYLNSSGSGRFNSVKDDIKKSGDLVQTINEKTGHLKGIAKKQTILSLNATIEAARSGEAGVGFAVVAKSMQDLSNQSAGIYNDIEKSVEEITNLINSIISELT